MKEVLMAIMDFALNNPQIQSVKICDGHTNEWIISSSSVELKKTTRGRYLYLKASKEEEGIKIESSLPYAESQLEELLFYLTCDDPTCIYSHSFLLCFFGAKIIDDPIGGKVCGLNALSLSQLKVLTRIENAKPPTQYFNKKRSWVDAIRRHRLREANKEIPEYLTYYN